MIEIILYIVLGLLLGIVLGLIPGLHPNMIALMLPLVSAANIEGYNLVAFAASLAVSNTFLDFIPSLLLGAPEPGKEMAMLPAHRMLLGGNGYDAVKLAVVGGLGSVIIIALALPILSLGLPVLYEIIKPFTYALLIFIVLVMVFSEKSKILAAIFFFSAGLIGIASSHIDVDSNLALFPILSGLFGVGTLLLSSREKIIPEKRRREISVSTRQRNRSILFGSCGGIFSGMLPGVGSSEIASMASMEKNEKSFLITIGAITIANTIMAMLMIWLIGKSRSGIAVFISQNVQATFTEFAVLAATCIFVAGICAVVTLKLAKRFLSRIEKTDYSRLNKAIVVLIVAMTIIFTGFYGLLLLTTCTALGILAIKMNVRRGVLMGVLILPTIIFYLPF